MRRNKKVATSGRVESSKLESEKASEWAEGFKQEIKRVTGKTRAGARFLFCL